MNTGKCFGELRHREAAHDLPLIHALVAHHCILIIATYDPAIMQANALTNAARTAVEALQELSERMQVQAQAEYPGADFLKQYQAAYTGTVWPPIITDQEDLSQ